MRKTWFPAVMVVAACGAMATTASAAPMGITCESFGELDVTFGGAGIPNDRVCYTTFDDGDNTITLGLTATQRFANPAVTDDGAGTFFAVTGGDTLNGAPTFARWNFDFHITVEDGGVAGDANYLFDLFYDFDPGVDTDESNLGRVGPIPSGGTGGTFEDSWNLGMAFLAVASPGLTPPAFGPFDPNAAGEYSFGIRAYNANAAEIGEIGINVETSPVPEPGSVAMLGVGMLGLAAMARRRRAARRN